MFLIAYRQLTKSLLKRDFGLKLELPDDRLCPPVCDILGTWLRETKVLRSRSPTGLLVSFFPPVPASLIVHQIELYSLDPRPVGHDE